MKAQDDFVQSPSDGYSIGQLFACDGCHEPRLLFTNVGGRHLCAECWHAIGSPFPRREAAPAETHAAEVATRERMQKRGGADRHLVRSGRS